MKTGIVTGVSAGIGEATVSHLPALGWRVIGFSRDPEHCAATAAEQASPNFTMLRADLSSLADTAWLAKEIVARAPVIDGSSTTPTSRRPLRYFWQHRRA